ncbi:MAG: methylenetetrahydrofolate reductase C-terminal domain-containing protein [Candidatus Omnitrophota bacterium]
MIITIQKPASEILEGLKGLKKVFLVGCGECATVCKTGGSDELRKIKEVLEKEGKTVLGSCIPDAPCIASQIKTEWARHIKEIKEAEAVLVLACGLGVQSVKDNDRMGLPVSPGCDTSFGAVVDARNNFYEKCSFCGECLLASTAGICPVTLCPKGILNGPCGGVNKGKCEVDKDKDCAWVLIYQALEKKGGLEEIKKIRKPRDFKKSLKPHSVNAR